MKPPKTISDDLLTATERVYRERDALRRKVFYLRRWLRTIRNRSCDYGIRSRYRTVMLACLDLASCAKFALRGDKPPTRKVRK